MKNVPSMLIPGQRFPVEQRKAEKLLSELRPSTAIYRGYRLRANRFLADFPAPLLTSDPSRKWLIGLQMHKSILFGLEYLVAYAAPRWFQENFPSTNAVATEHIKLGPITSPPLVFVPASKRTVRDHEFKSVLEHEFVHINQIILGAFPGSPQGDAKDLTKNLFEAIRAEYEANLIQLVRWPNLYVRSGKKYGLSLDTWSAFRGYTQGLEHIVHAAAKGQIKEKEFLIFLDQLPAAIPERFQRMGFNGKLGEYCAKNVKGHVSVAFENIGRGNNRASGISSWLYH